MRHKKRFRPKLCARCGFTSGQLTRDHFLPQRFLRDNLLPPSIRGSNVIYLCEKCNRLKGSKIVMPWWYIKLSQSNKNKLALFMKRYKRLICQYIDDTADEYKDEKEIGILKFQINKL